MWEPSQSSPLPLQADPPSSRRGDVGCPQVPDGEVKCTPVNHLCNSSPPSVSGGQPPPPQAGGGGFSLAARLVLRPPLPIGLLLQRGSSRCGGGKCREKGGGECQPAAYFPASPGVGKKDFCPGSSRGGGEGGGIEASTGSRTGPAAGLQSPVVHRRWGPRPTRPPFLSALSFC